MPLLIVGALIALTAAALAGYAVTCKHRGARACGAVSVSTLASSRPYKIGLLCAIAAAGLQIIALATAPMSLVKALMASGLVWTVMLAGQGRQGLRGAALTCLGIAGVATLFSTGRPIVGQDDMVIATVLTIYAMLAAAASRSGRPALLAAGAGLMLACADLLVKAGVDETFWWWLAMPPVVAAGLIMQARAFHAHEIAVHGQGVISVAVSSAGILCGTVAFGEPAPASALTVVAAAICLGSMLGGMIWCSREVQDVRCA